MNKLSKISRNKSIPSDIKEYTIEFCKKLNTIAEYRICNIFYDKLKKYICIEFIHKTIYMSYNIFLSGKKYLLTDTETGIADIKSIDQYTDVFDYL